MTAEFLLAEPHALLAEVDLGVYSLPALLKVAYRFTDRCFLHLQFKEGSDKQFVEVRFLSRPTTPSLQQIPGEFLNELLDQTLREHVARDSEPERNLILAHALSRTSLLHPELEAQTTDTPVVEHR